MQGAEHRRVRWEDGEFLPGLGRPAVQDHTRHGSMAEPAVGALRAPLTTVKKVLTSPLQPALQPAVVACLGSLTQRVRMSCECWDARVASAIWWSRVLPVRRVLPGPFCGGGRRCRGRR